MNEQKVCLTEGFLHALTPLCVYDEIPLIDFDLKARNEPCERLFEIVGVEVSHEWDSYFLVQIPRKGTKTPSHGVMALTVPMKHRPHLVYGVGDYVVIGWSKRRKHFYIERAL